MEWVSLNAASGSFCYNVTRVRFIANMGNALVTAFGTASSSASLPVTINSLEQKNHIDPRISRSGLLALKLKTYKALGLTMNLNSFSRK